MCLLKLKNYHTCFLTPKTPTPCRMERQPLRAGKSQLLSHILYWSQRNARRQHPSGPRGQRMGNHGPFAPSVELRPQRGHGQWEGSMGVEVPRRVQSHLFPWSINNLVPLATLFLEPAFPPFWESSDSGQLGDNCKENK